MTNGQSGAEGQGTIFEVSPAGALLQSVTVHGGSEPQDPQARLILGADGNFYGTSYAGGTGEVGTIFQFNSAGTVLVTHALAGSPTEGGHPEGTVVQGSDGNFSGTTEYGGSNSLGTIYRVTPSGDFTTLVNITSANVRNHSPP